MKKRLGPNDPCSCGSGKKLKKCCGAGGTVVGYNRADRQSAYHKLDEYVGNELGPEDDEAYDEFWGRWKDVDHDFSPELYAISESAQDAWFYFDRPLDDDSLVVDEALAAMPFTAGERNFLTSMRATAMHLYEVVSAVPGVSLTLRDVLEGDRVTVNERLGSKSIPRHEWIAARIVARGPSGGPELETGMLLMPSMYHQSLRDQLTAFRAEFVRDRPGVPIQILYKQLAPFFHEVWATSILEPALPALQNTDGESLLPTRVMFDVTDEQAAIASLDAASELERDEGLSWSWAGTNQRGEPIARGSLNLEGTRLTLETNSENRATRGREIIERAAGAAVRHRATVHEDLERPTREALRAWAMGGEGPAPPSPDIPPEVAEALALNYYGRHYRAWIDESIPALEGATPRAAAKDPRLQGILVELIQGLEGMYQRALMDGAPAYDPSWMWAELGFEDEPGLAHPPPLAHERLAELVPGAAEMSRTVAEGARQMPSFSDRSTVFDDAEVRGHVTVRAFLKGLERPANDDGAPAWQASQLPPYLSLMVNFDLHRRKSFWVDEALAYMLGHTELDALGRELRVPLPSFALVFTDRRVLSLGERLLSKDPRSPLAGQFLEVATVYVTEHPDGPTGRRLRVTFALDALGSDLPQLVSHELVLEDDTQVGKLVQDSGPPLVACDPPVEDTSPIRGLLHTVVNAILYATSAGVEPQKRVAPKAPKKRSSPRLHGAESRTSAEDVYHLPGAIEISQLRRYQSLERIPDGRKMLHRFMVRGHWRRPSKNWTDQRMRWIEPYWKGPDIAAVIERVYKLKP